MNLKKPFLVALQQPVIVEQIKDKSVINECLEFLGCKNINEVKRLHQNYIPRLVPIVSIALVKLIEKKYKIVEDFPKEIHSVSDLNTYWGAVDEQTFLSSGNIFMENKDGAKLILSLRHSWHAPTQEPSAVVQIDVHYKNLSYAYQFFRELKENISNIKGEKFTGAGSFLSNEKKKYTWDDIILTKEAKKVVESNIIKFLELYPFFKEQGIPHKRGIIFYGPPGNGKTLIGKVLADNIDANFVWVTPKDICKYTPSHSIGEIYEFARLIAPAIVFFEDIDLIGGRDRDSMAVKEFLGELLNQLDGFESNNGIITIATTNDIEALDKGLSNRPGRFDVKLEFPNPDFDIRLKILQKTMKEFNINEKIDLNEVANLTEGFSCAHVREVIVRSLIASVESKSTIDITCIKDSIAAMSEKKKAVGF